MLCTGIPGTLPSHGQMYWYEKIAMLGPTMSAEGRLSLNSACYSLIMVIKIKQQWPPIIEYLLWNWVKGFSSNNHPYNMHNLLIFLWGQKHPELPEHTQFFLMWSTLGHLPCSSCSGLLHPHLFCPSSGKWDCVSPSTHSVGNSHPSHRGNRWPKGSLAPSLAVVILSHRWILRYLSPMQNPRTLA